MVRVRFRVSDRVRVGVRLWIGWYMDEQTAVGSVGAGGMEVEVAVYARVTKPLHAAVALLLAIAEPLPCTELFYKH